MNFAKLFTIGSARARRAGDAKLWSPRDVLIDMLRRVDAGEVKADALIVCWRDDGAGEHGYRVSSPNVGVTVAMLEIVKHEVIR